MFKQFSTSTVLGIFLGLALIGYSAFAAFQPPTAAPPGNNVAPPINTSDVSQSKGAGLIVNINDINVTGLQVNGYLQVDLTSGSPPSGDCDTSDEYGRMQLDSGTGLLYICASSGWVTK